MSELLERLKEAAKAFEKPEAEPEQPKKKTFIQQALGSAGEPEPEEPKPTFISRGYTAPQRDVNKELQERLAAARRNDWWANGGANILADAREQEKLEESQRQNDIQTEQSSQQFADSQEFTAGQNDANRDFQAQQEALRQVQAERMAELQRTQKLSDDQKARLAAANANQSALLKLGQLGDDPEYEFTPEQKYSGALSIAKERGVPVAELLPSLMSDDSSKKLIGELQALAVKDPRNEAAKTILKNLQSGESILSQIPNMISVIAIDALGIKESEVSNPAMQAKILDRFKNYIDPDMMNEEIGNTLNSILSEDYKNYTKGL